MLDLRPGALLVKRCAGLTLPESGELGRDDFVVSDLPFEGADLAGEPADAVCAASDSEV
jgi:hypothetical protein